MDLPRMFMRTWRSCRLACKTPSSAVSSRGARRDWGGSPTTSFRRDSTTAIGVSHRNFSTLPPSRAAATASPCASTPPTHPTSSTFASKPIDSILASTMPTVIHLRAETKPFERRSPRTSKRPRCPAIPRVSPANSQRQFPPRRPRPSSTQDIPFASKNPPTASTVTTSSPLPAPSWSPAARGSRRPRRTSSSA